MAKVCLNCGHFDGEYCPYEEDDDGGGVCKHWVKESFEPEMTEREAFDAEYDQLMKKHPTLIRFISNCKEIVWCTVQDVKKIIMEGVA